MANGDRNVTRGTTGTAPRAFCYVGRVGQRGGHRRAALAGGTEKASSQGPRLDPRQPAAGRWEGALARGPPGPSGRAAVGNATVGRRCGSGSEVPSSSWQHKGHLGRWRGGGGVLMSWSTWRAPGTRVTASPLSCPRGTVPPGQLPRGASQRDEHRGHWHFSPRELGVLL